MKTDNLKTTLLEKGRGFTLIEVLIAMAIFSVGILAVAGMQISNTKNNTTGNITTEATMLARQKMEELKTVSVVSDLDALNGGTDMVGVYTRQWNVANPLGGSTSRQITVTVSWNGNGPGQNRWVQLESITRGNGT